MTKTAPSLEAPYPGLRPFKSSEEPVFFGRSGQVAEMLTQLEQHQFLAVVGASGCGKSSLVRAGLLPTIRQGLMLGWPGEWHIVVSRPGDGPYANLARAFHSCLNEEEDDPHDSLWMGSKTDEDVYSEVRFLEAVLRSGSQGLSHAVSDAGIPDDTGVLILIDQFEELFRFRERVQQEQTDPDDEQQKREHVARLARRRDESTGFVNMLLETVRQSQRPIYVVLTMRSDFLGECDSFHGLPEQVNRSQFLTPRMTREQLADAITRPVEQFGWRIAPELSSRILNDVARHQDQLPLMQHSLLRVWQLALTDSSRRRSQEDGDLLTLTDYEQPRVGGLRNALSKHADEVFAELSGTEQRVCKVLFQSLSEPDEEQRVTRRLSTISEVAKIANVHNATVERVVEAFSGPGRSFIVRHADGSLDISHESLLRRWERLEGWIAEEEQSAGIYRHLARQARLWKQKEASLLRGPDLVSARRWWDRDPDLPNNDWADRYDRGFEHASDYLRQSRRAARLRFGGGVVLAVAFVALSIYSQWAKVQAEDATATALRNERKANKATQEADEQRKVADSERSKTQQLLNLNRVSLAHKALQNDDLETARRQLSEFRQIASGDDAVTPSDWNYVQRLASLELWSGRVPLFRAGVDGADRTEQLVDVTLSDDLKQVKGYITVSDANAQSIDFVDIRTFDIASDESGPGVSKSFDEFAASTPPRSFEIRGQRVLASLDLPTLWLQRPMEEMKSIELEVPKRALDGWLETLTGWALSPNGRWLIVTRSVPSNDEFNFHEIFTLYDARSGRRLSQAAADGITASLCFGTGNRVIYRGTRYGELHAYRVDAAGDLEVDRWSGSERRALERERQRLELEAAPAPPGDIEAALFPRPYTVAGVARHLVDRGDSSQVEWSRRSGEILSARLWRNAYVADQPVTALAVCRDGLVVCGTGGGSLVVVAPPSSSLEGFAPDFEAGLRPDNIQRLTAGVQSPSAHRLLRPAQAAMFDGPRGLMPRVLSWYAVHTSAVTSLWLSPGHTMVLSGDSTGNIALHPVYRSMPTQLFSGPELASRTLGVANDRLILALDAFDRAESYFVRGVSDTEPQTKVFLEAPTASAPEPAPAPAPPDFEAAPAPVAVPAYPVQLVEVDLRTGRTLKAMQLPELPPRPIFSELLTVNAPMNSGQQRITMVVPAYELKASADGRLVGCLQRGYDGEPNWTLTIVDREQPGRSSVASMSGQILRFHFGRHDEADISHCVIERPGRNEIHVEKLRLSTTGDPTQAQFEKLLETDSPFAVLNADIPGLLAVGDPGGHIQVIDLTTNKSVVKRQLAFDDRKSVDSIRALTWSSELPDGGRELMVCEGGDAGSIAFWPIRSQSEKRKDILRYGAPVVGAAFSPDGVRIVLATSDAIEVWDRQRETLTISFNRNAVQSIGVAGPESQREEYYPDGVSEIRNGIRFSAEGDHLIATSNTARVLIWDMSHPLSQADRRSAVMQLDARLSVPALLEKPDILFSDVEERAIDNDALGLSAEQKQYLVTMRRRPFADRSERVFWNDIVRQWVTLPVNSAALDMSADGPAENLNSLLTLSSVVAQQIVERWPGRIGGLQTRLLTEYRRGDIGAVRSTLVELTDLKHLYGEARIRAGIAAPRPTDPPDDMLLESNAVIESFQELGVDTTGLTEKKQGALVGLNTDAA